MKQEILSHLTWYASMVAQPVQYNWSDEFSKKHISDVTDIFLDNIKNEINWSNLTAIEALELGFRRWSNDVPDLYLIPLYLLPILPVGTEVTSIFQEKIIYNGNNIDNDVRGGCLAYGLIIN